MKNTTFCVRIFDISPYVFTQIPSGRAQWMWDYFASNEYPHYILLTDPATLETRNT